MKLTRDRLKQIIKEELEETIGENSSGIVSGAEEDRETKINHALRAVSYLIHDMITKFETELSSLGVTDLNNPEQVLQDYVKSQLGIEPVQERKRR